MAHRVVHFEIHVDDPGRAERFFGNVFGWTFDKWEGPEPYWLITTGADDEPGINGGMMKRRDPAGSVYNTIQVDSIDDAVERIEAAGGEIVVGKMAISGVGWSAYFTDTEGNVHGIHEFNPDAA